MTLCAQVLSSLAQWSSALPGTWRSKYWAVKRTPTQYSTSLLAVRRGLPAITLAAPAAPPLAVITVHASCLARRFIRSPALEWLGGHRHLRTRPVCTEILTAPSPSPWSPAPVEFI